MARRRSQPACISPRDAPPAPLKRSTAVGLMGSACHLPVTSRRMFRVLSCACHRNQESVATVPETRHAAGRVGGLPRTRRRSVHDSRNLSRAPPASLRDRLRRPLTEPACRQDRQLSGSGEGPGQDRALSQGRGDLGGGDQGQRLTATVTATAAANRCQQRPATAHNTRTICANWGYVRPEKRKVGSSTLPLTTSTSTGIPAPERGFRCSVDRYGSILPGVPGCAAECRLVRGIPVGRVQTRTCGIFVGHAGGLRRLM